MSNKPPPPPPPPPHPPRKKPPQPPLFSPLTPPHSLKKPPHPHPPPSPPPPPHPPTSPSPVQPPPPSTGDNKTYRDCIQGICSLNCPQFCTFLPFPPPPPFFLNSATSDDDDDSNKISPLIASLIAVLAAAFLLLFYYTVVYRYLRRRRRLSSSEIRLDPLVQDPARPAGLDESFIRQITVFRYRRGDGLVEGTECAVCLSEFSENESLRLMPNCEHAFHIPCIDTWLQSHSSCPLCRSGMDPVDPVRTDPGRTGGVNLAHMRVQRSGGGDDTVLVVRQVEGEVIVCHEFVDVRDNCEIKSDPSLLLN